MRLAIYILITAMVLGITIPGQAGKTSEIDSAKKIDAIQKQIEDLQTQLNGLKQELAKGETKSAENKNLVVASNAVPSPALKSTWWQWQGKNNSFKLRDTVGLKEESRLNIAGELNFRGRYNIDEENLNDEGFQFYEIELFLDAEVNDYTAIFVEYPISHKNFLNPGNSWIDFHLIPGTLAATEETGLMIGNFSPRFGYLNYDDNQSWIYGGRTTTNTPLVRSKAIDSQVIRSRQIGISAPIKFGPILLEPGVFNGSGPIEFSGGADNDRKVDLSGRLQYTLPNDFGLVGIGTWYSPKTGGAIENTAGTRWGGNGAKHVRDISRYAVYAKYPNVQQATLPDLSLGGKPFLVYGECIWGTFHANSDFTTSKFFMNFDQDFLGWYIELNFNMIRDKLVGVVRYDYFDPNTDAADDTLMDITPAIKWNVWNNVWLTGGYEYYFGGKNAIGKNDDRVTLELNVWF